MAVFTTIIVVFGVLLFGLPGGSSNEGIYLEFNLYEIRNGKLVPVKPTPDMYLFVKIDAVTPNTTVTIVEANAKFAKKVFVPTGRLREVAQEWVKEYEGRNSDVESLWSGLFISIHIARVSGQSVEQMYYVVDSISYNPHRVEKSGKLKIILNMRKDLRTAQSKVEHDINPLEIYNPLDRYIDITKPSAEASCYLYIRYERVYSITPETLYLYRDRLQLPTDYFTIRNGKIYIKTPVIIVYNYDQKSPRVSFSILIGHRNSKLGIYPTFGTGNILSNLTKGIVPDITLWKGSIFTWGGETYRFILGEAAEGGEGGWIWVWGRPMFEIYRVYAAVNCGIYYQEWYLGDEARAYVADVITAADYPVGGVELGLPAWSLMNFLFSGSSLERVVVPGTSLSDGKLDPKEYIPLRHIIRHWDRCGADFEVGIPVGALLAGACSSLGGISAIACASFLSMFAVSFSIEGSHIQVDGSLYNDGVPVDKSEVVYMAVSRYSYRVDPPWWCPWCSPCYYKVPVGIYFVTD